MDLPNAFPEHRAMIISHFQLRRAIGWAGVALPVVLYFAFIVGFPNCPFPQSISHFYYTPLGTYFTGTLFAVAVFLFFYRLPEKTDRRAAQLAGFAAIVIACCPTYPYCTSCMECSSIFWIPFPWSTALHYASAGLFFCILAFFCFFLFTKTNPAQAPSAQKMIRNRIYRICGTTILLCMILLCIYDGDTVIFQFSFFTLPPLTFMLESIALLAFGLSWLIKGETLWRDK
ncbi:MAG: DUF998 domain-containing protein [Chitinophagia bacterium]|jgi:hypothetical protein